jgi:hypothetical protein
MKQKGDKSNNFQIGKAGTGNTFNVNQNSRYFRDEAVQLLKRNTSHQPEITNEAVTRRSLITLLSATLPLVALLADVLGIFVALNIDITWFIPVYVILVTILLLSNLDHVRIFFKRRKIKRKDTYIGGGKIAHLNSNGTFSLYERTARCLYPNCQGFIEVVAPPQKEQGKFFLAGKCTECGTSHSYKIDPNWVAYPCDLDWSEN